MLKIRLQGTPEDIKWFRGILEKQPEVKITEFSDLFKNIGTNKYFRTYVEVEKEEHNVCAK